MIAILPTSSSGSSGLPIAASAGTDPQTGPQGFVFTLAAAESSLNSGENESTENGFQENSATENNPLQTHSGQSDSIETRGSNGGPVHAPLAKGAEISTTSSWQPITLNSQSKKPAGVSASISFPSLNVPSIIDPQPQHTQVQIPQLSLAVIPSNGPQPDVTQPDGLPFQLSGQISAPGTAFLQSVSQTSLAAIPSVPFQPQPSGIATSVPVSGRMPSAELEVAGTNSTLPNQVTSAQRSAEDGWPNAIDSSTGTNTTIQTDAPRLAPAPVPPAVEVEAELSVQAIIRTSSEGASSQSPARAESTPNLESSAPTEFVPPDVSSLSVAAYSGPIASASGPTPASSTLVGFTQPSGEPQDDQQFDATRFSSVFSSVSAQMQAESMDSLAAAQGAPLMAEMQLPQQAPEWTDAAQISAQTVAPPQADSSAASAAESSESDRINDDKDGASVLSALAGFGAPASIAALKTAPPVSAQLATAFASLRDHSAAGNSVASSRLAATLPASPARPDPSPATTPQTPAPQAPDTQTPFSVFFSGAASSVQSAVSVLPKMILPPSISEPGTRLSQPGTPGGAAGTAQGIGSHSGAKQSAAPQIAGSSTKEPAGDNGNFPAAQATHTTTDAGANLEIGTAEAVVTQAPSPSIPAQVNVLGNSETVSTPNLTQQNPSQTGSGAGPNASTLIPASTGAPAAPEASTPQVLGAVQAAQLLNRSGQSEMRIGLSTTAFGSVEVRTTVRTSDVGLVIGSEKGDLHTLLANELPAVASTLQQQNLRLNSVNFMQGFAFANNTSGGGNSQQRGFVPTQMHTDHGSADTADENSSEVPPATAWSGGSNFSILA